MPNTRDGRAATHHFFCKAIADVSFPATKRSVSAAAGQTVIPLNGGKSATVDELLQMITPESFICAAALFCALSAALEDNC